jgi:hypothetical protein
MTNVLQYALESYRDNLQLILVFSLIMLIAFLIPILASFPTYQDLGGIFLRTSSAFLAPNILTVAVIVISTLLSLLFLSFAVVAINVIVKHKRTHTRIRQEVLRGLETYTGRVFGIILLYTIIILAISTASYAYNVPQILTYLIALVLSPLFFYSPSSVVIDDHKVWSAMRSSVRFFKKRIGYFALWIVTAIVLITVFDLVSIAVGGSAYAGLLMLVFNSIFILPFLMILQSQSYMRKFSLLKN